MSDLHLTKDGGPIWETNTMEHFNQSIDIIRGLQKIDAILVTGDVSDDGSEWTYQYADRLFSTLGIPTLCCPGNHDSLKMMLEEYKPSFCKFLNRFHPMSSGKSMSNCDPLPSATGVRVDRCCM